MARHYLVPTTYLACTQITSRVDFCQLSVSLASQALADIGHRHPVTPCNPYLHRWLASRGLLTAPSRTNEAFRQAQPPTPLKELGRQPTSNTSTPYYLLPPLQGQGQAPALTWTHQKEALREHLTASSPTPYL